MNHAGPVPACRNLYPIYRPYILVLFVTLIWMLNFMQGNCKAVADEYIECELMVIDTKNEFEKKKGEIEHKLYV